MTDPAGSGLLAGRVALVSGAGPGLGRALALNLAAHGADIVLAARRAEVLDDVAAEVVALGRRVVHRATDITRSADCERLVAAALAELGRLDVVVNNAHRGGTSHPFLETFEGADVDGAWQAAMEVNLWGSLTMTRAAAPALARQEAGRVVMIASMSIRDVRPAQGPYAVSKAALVAATRTLARELGPAGTRVNAVVPGYIRGAAVERWLESQAEERGVSVAVVAEELAESTALGAIPTEDEIAGTVVFLASDLSRPVTGQAIDVNAGQWV